MTHGPAEEIANQRVLGDRWYPAFVSMVFGVFIALWVQPFGKMLEDGANLDATTWRKDRSPAAEMVLEWTAIAPPSMVRLRVTPFLALIFEDKANGNFWSVMVSMVFLRGLVMLVVLVCLWWWYAKFLARVHPPAGIIYYGMDFVSLGSFALAFQFWPDEEIFPWTVAVGAFLMMSRLALTYFCVQLVKGTPDYNAIRLALGALFAVLLASAGALAAFDSGPNDHRPFEHWRLEQANRLLVIALSVGCFITLRCAQMTEGLFPDCSAHRRSSVNAHT